MATRAILATLLLAGLGLAGCGSQPRSAAPSAGDVAKALRGSPPLLAELHGQANRLLAGGPAAFEARLRRLRGLPVVVNEWASWCGPCRSEFPIYQRVAVADGRQVAFLGIDAKDADAAAAAFLRSFPVTYPSYADPGGAISSALHAYTAYPQSFFFDRSGRMTYDKAGPYLSAGDLQRDIRNWALR